MDTKWKNRKNAISFIVFLFGVSLTMGSLAGILRDKPAGVRLWQTERLFEGDYQQNYRFQDYITGRFWSFLTMAVGGDLERSWGYDGDVYWDGYYYSGYDGGPLSEGGWTDEWQAYQDNLEAMNDTYDEMTDTYEEMEQEWERIQEENAHDEAETYRQGMESYREEMEALREESEAYQNEMGISRDHGRNEPSDEEKKKTAQKYHDRLKGDKNLLYTISYDGKTLYANSQLLTPDGKMTAPKGYNFLLYFDGEKVRIVKDGKELDVYGDGYYREENSWEETGERGDWYVPGYLNIPVDESMKGARVFLAAAQDPVLYMKENYGNGGALQYDNSLYWMNYNCQANRRLLEKELACFAAGLLLLFLTFLGRKGRREAEARIALFQAGIWVECKALLFAGLVWFVLFIIKWSNQDYGLWRELTEAYYYDYGSEGLLMYGGEVLGHTHPFAWVLLFWGIWLSWNDLRHNREVWRCSLAGKLYRTFSAKSISWPLAKKMACRNRGLFAAVAVYVFVMLLMAIQWTSGYRSTIALVLLGFLCTAGLLFLAYLTARKNLETARDMEAVSGWIGEIQNGNYRAMEGDFAGHDLQKVMAQLEDIRHGMETAVEEQMRSQKMKVELIANVSHDIKTPLTSIISYVQFLKQEEDLPEHVKDYVKILDEKSQRLKNMVQDVFAVSKAASGELPMHMEELDFGKLLCQTLADMQEQIDGSAVSFRTELPQAPVMILADGQRMYRVFQNLFQNAIQYSLAGSRVYVTLKTDGTMAVASVKNASLMELDKKKDFAERFARGDQSRTDGGSGLGLSIAQSFTEACGGEFSWETDADLFVVKVSFQTLK